MDGARKGSRPGSRRPRFDVLEHFSARPFLVQNGAALFQLLVQLASLDDLEGATAQQLVSLILREMELLREELDEERDRETARLFEQIQTALPS